ncbi:MAG: hypothetical protein RMY62_027145 [Nostoc sp. ZfuVER08]|jgi:hypothetical protein|nr:hypothetical protein [Nostoc punctiforme]MDZ8014617.1 hypothetical protein [Nostoc sp. ZfuVER08]
MVVRSLPQTSSLKISKQSTDKNNQAKKFSDFAYQVLPVGV